MQVELDSDGAYKSVNGEKRIYEGKIIGVDIEPDKAYSASNYFNLLIVGSIMMYNK